MSLPIGTLIFLNRLTDRSNGAYTKRCKMAGSQADPDLRALYAGALRSATQRAMRPGVMSDKIALNTENRRSNRRSVSDDYPESMASDSTLSSRPASPAISNTSPVFGPAVYICDHDQFSDSMSIMSHSRQTSLDPQYYDHAKAPLSRLSSGRTQSLKLPLRVRQDSPAEEKQLKRATTSAGRASSANSWRFDVRGFE